MPYPTLSLSEQEVTKTPASALIISSKLSEAISSFAKFAEEENYDSPEGAQDMCNHASDEFLHELAKYDIEGEIEHYETHIEIDVQDYPHNLHRCYFHWAVRVGEWIIDWTARQFDEDAPFPAVWEGERREWRNVQEKSE